MFPSQASHGFCVTRPPCPLPFFFENFYTQFKTPEAMKLPMTITEYILIVFHIHVPVSHNLLAMFLQDIQDKCIFPSLRLVIRENRAALTNFLEPQQLCLSLSGGTQVGQRSEDVAGGESNPHLYQD